MRLPPANWRMKTSALSSLEVHILETPFLSDKTSESTFREAVVDTGAPTSVIGLKQANLYAQSHG
jgi:hypothetical protein